MGIVLEPRLLNAQSKIAVAAYSVEVFEIKLAIRQKELFDRCPPNEITRSIQDARLPRRATQMQLSCPVRGPRDRQAQRHGRID
jgi:hypothetical protein